MLYDDKKRDSYILNRILSSLIYSNNIFVRSITTDNGFEFRKLGLLAYKFDICIYFTNKYEFLKKGGTMKIEMVYLEDIFLKN